LYSQLLLSRILPQLVVHEVYGRKAPGSERREPAPLGIFGLCGVRAAAPAHARTLGEGGGDLVEVGGAGGFDEDYVAGGEWVWSQWVAALLSGRVDCSGSGGGGDRVGGGADCGYQVGSGGGVLADGVVLGFGAGAEFEHFAQRAIRRVPWIAARASRAARVESGLAL